VDFHKNVQAANGYPLNQSSVHVPVTGSNVCGAHAIINKSVTSCETRANWSLVEDVLVNAWKEIFFILSRLTKTRRGQKSSSVCSVGNKTLKQSKDKITNLKDLYKAAKDKNKRTKESLNTSIFYPIFDEVLGCKHAITMPHITERREKFLSNLLAEQNGG